MQICGKIHTLALVSAIPEFHGLEIAQHNVFAEHTKRNTDPQLRTVLYKGVRHHLKFYGMRTYKCLGIL